MKYFISSDVHSFYDEWRKELKKKGFDKNNPEHIIIHCGDLLDRGTKPLQCLRFVNRLYDQGRAILIKGNHEDLLEHIFTRGYFQQHDMHNGTLDTCCYITNMELDGFNLSNQKLIIDTTKDNPLVKKYLSHVVNYAELGDNIFVHGWIPTVYNSESKLVYDPDWRNASDSYWYDARWVNGMQQWREGIKEPGKTIWCGHWHASYGNAKYHNDGLEFMPRWCYIDDTMYVNNHTFADEGIRAVDACTALSRFVNVEVIEL